MARLAGARAGARLTWHCRARRKLALAEGERRDRSCGDRGAASRCFGGDVGDGDEHAKTVSGISHFMCRQPLMV